MKDEVCHNKLEVEEKHSLIEFSPLVWTHNINYEKRRKSNIK